MISSEKVYLLDKGLLCCDEENNDKYGLSKWGQGSRELQLSQLSAFRDSQVPLLLTVGYFTYEIRNTSSSHYNYKTKKSVLPESNIASRISDSNNISLKLKYKTFFPLCLVSARTRVLYSGFSLFNHQTLIRDQTKRQMSFMSCHGIQVMRFNNLRDAWQNQCSILMVVFDSQLTHNNNVVDSYSVLNTNWE